MSSGPGNVDECTDETDVDDDCKGAEKGVSSKAKNEQNCEDGVKRGSTSYTLNCSPSVGDVDVVVGKDLKNALVIVNQRHDSHLQPRSMRRYQDQRQRSRIARFAGRGRRSASRIRRGPWLKVGGSKQA